jgi:hypothetical protein
MMARWLSSAGASISTMIVMLRDAYESEVANDETNKATLIAADYRNAQIQTMARKDVDPDRHDDE